MGRKVRTAIFIDQDVIKKAKELGLDNSKV